MGRVLWDLPQSVRGRQKSHSMRPLMLNQPEGELHADTSVKQTRSKFARKSRGVHFHSIVLV
jgi:hypothetical protein